MGQEKDPPHRPTTEVVKNASHRARTLRLPTEDPTPAQKGPNEATPKQSLEEQIREGTIFTYTTKKK